VVERLAASQEGLGSMELVNLMPRGILEVDSLPICSRLLFLFDLKKK
jgi:hypothetical protein